MKQQTKNNFLNWFGDLIDEPFNVTSIDYAKDVFVNQIEVTLPFTEYFAGSNSTYPANPESISIVDFNTSSPPVIASDESITCKFPEAKLTGDSYFVKYIFYDIAGHQSNVATITFNII